MKRIILFLATISAIYSCTKETQTTTVLESKKEFNIEVKNVLGSTNKIEILLTDSLGNDVFAASQLFINENILTTNYYSVLQNETYMLKVIYKRVVYLLELKTDSNSKVSYSLKGSNPLGYTKKALLEFYTGTWCGICPGLLIPLDEYINKHPKLLPTAVHGPSGSSDPFVFQFDQQLRTAFNITGVPTSVINRNFNWNNDTTVLNQLTSGFTNVGLSLETSVSGTTINITSKVAFDSSIKIPLKIVVNLVEDSIAHNQANYGHFGLPNPIVNLCHRYILRKNLTDLLGDAIPATKTVANSTYTTTYSINASSYNLSHCNIVAYVVYDNNTMGKKGVLNGQITKAGFNQVFD